MERSTPNDGSDDRSDDPWDRHGNGRRGGASDRDLDGYPVAPLPAHERQWRHPSEIGQQSWVLSEPPMALGRGLLVTTGAIGCAISLAILWMLFPVGGTGPIAEPVVTRSTNTIAPRRTAANATAPAASATTSSALIGSSSSAPIGSVGPSLTLPAEDVPSNTVMLHSAEAVENAAIAVLIGDSTLMITTAHAVGNDTELSVMLDSGDTGMATVVGISDSIAYLQASDAPGGTDLVTVGFAMSAEAVPGDVVHVLSPDPVSFTYEGDNQLGGVLQADVVEGTPVVNDDGALVALCSHDGQGIVFVPVPPPADDPATSVGDDAEGTKTTDTGAPAGGTDPAGTATTQPSTNPGTGTTTPAAQGEAWLGLRLASTVDGLPGVTVLSVSPGSPAEVAGFEAGQRLLAIDDVTVRSATDVAAILQSHRPGDVIVVTVSSPVAATSPATTSPSGPSGSQVATTLPATTSPAGTTVSAAPTTTAAKPTAPSSTIASNSTTPATTGVSGTASTASPTTQASLTSTTMSGSGSGATANVAKLSVVLGEREPTV